MVKTEINIYIKINNYYKWKLAGSATGALNAPEFVFERKPVTLQYSRDESRSFLSARSGDRPRKDFSRDPEPPKQPKMDWICENVSWKYYFNFIIFIIITI